MPITKIDGTYGTYDNIVKNPYVKYGRNAINNYYYFVNNINYPGNLRQDAFEYSMPDDIGICEYRYSPENRFNPVNKMSLLGASYEELGDVEISTSEYVQDCEMADFEPANDIADIVDLNHDGKIDIAENATTILLEDSLSSPDGKPDGVIDTYGQMDAFEMLDVGPKALILCKLKGFYKNFNLNQAKQEFLKDKNNAFYI